MATKKKDEQNDKCENCGACKHCGSGGVKFIPYPMYPPYPNPYARPTTPYWQSPWTCGTADTNQIGGGGFQFTSANGIYS